MINNLIINQKIPLSSVESSAVINPPFSTLLFSPVFAPPLGNIPKLTSFEAKIEEKKKLYKDAFRLLNVTHKLFFLDTYLSSISKCHRVSYGHYVSILKNGNSKSYGGLKKCHSVFSCPVCSVNLALKRKEQVSTAISEAIKQKINVSMLTLTFSHNKWHKLKFLLDALSDSTIGFFRQMGVRNILKDLGLVGRITRLEDTWGANSGWHPHIHILLFTKKEVDEKRLEVLLEDYWINELQKNDLSGKKGIALNVQNGLKAEHYLAKLSLEMTLSQYKKNPDRISGFGLLHKYLETRDSMYLNLFKERAYALKGKHFLSFSRGLAKQFGIVLKNDKDTSEEIEEQSELVLMLLYRDFKNKILKNHLAGDLLDMVDNRQLLKAFLKDLDIHYYDDPEQMKPLLKADKQDYYKKRKIEVYTE